LYSVDSAGQPSGTRIAASSDVPSGSRKVVYAALAGNALIALTKFAAAARTASSTNWTTA